MIDKLPTNIKEFIRNNRETKADGYIRFFSEREIEDFYNIVKESSIWNGGIPFAYTVFGDIIAWEDGYVVLYRMPEAESKIILSGTSFFFENIEDKEYQNDYFDMELYRKLKEKYGDVTDDKCYIIEPIPEMGGARELKYMNIGDFKTYLSLLV